MAKKKVVKKAVDKPTNTIKNDNRDITTIILQQSSGDVVKHNQAHYFILKSGEIVKGLELNQIGKHCEGADLDSIGIILEGNHYTTGQQAALMNVIHTCLSETNENVIIKGYDTFHADGVNPNINVRSLITKFKQTYRRG